MYHGYAPPPLKTYFCQIAHIIHCETVIILKLSDLIRIVVRTVFPIGLLSCFINEYKNFLTFLLINYQFCFQEKNTNHVDKP